MPKTLGYEQIESLPPTGVHLHDSGEVVRLVRVPRYWVALFLGLVLPAVCAGGVALVVATSALLIWQMLPYGPPPAVLFSLSLLALLPLANVGFAIFCLADFHRHGIIPTVLEATATGIERIAPAMWGVARTHWAVDKVEGVELWHMRDVFTRRRVSELRIRIKGRWTTLTMRLSYEDDGFPDRAAAAFRRVLGVAD